MRNLYLIKREREREEEEERQVQPHRLVHTQNFDFLQESWVYLALNLSSVTEEVSVRSKMTKILREPICSLAGSAPPRSLFPMNYLNPASSARAHLVRVHSYTRARANAFSLARYASRRRRLEMEMEVEVCHRVNGPLSFLRPLPPLFFFFLFLLPGRLLVS